MLNTSAEYQPVPFQIPSIAPPVFEKRQVDIRDFGAVGDAKTLNTEAFRMAVKECSAAGGGTVMVPSGLWLTGPIHFKSNIRLHLNRNAVILFSDWSKD